MATPRIDSWRPFYLLGALLILVGGPQHPGGTMAQMLADPAWVPSHTMMLGGFVALLVGLLLHGRRALPERTRRWVRIAALGTALQAVEMVLHTAAVVDAAHLSAGEATPVLSAHLALSVVAYPVFAVTVIGLIVAAARERALGSPWIAWLGVAGAAAHGAATPLVVAAGLEQFRVLFPGIAAFGLWLLLAALWPARAAAPRTAECGTGAVAA